MATLAEARAPIGICNFCKAEIAKGKMTQHLKTCKQRRQVITAADADTTKQKTKLYSLLVEGKYNPQYWMYIELPASESLYTLDTFLRKTWVECCGHLSAFTIDGTSYDSEPDDFYFDIPNEETPNSEEAEIEDTEVEDAEDTIDVAGWLEDEHNLFSKGVPSILLDELKQPRPSDELVALLKAKLKMLPGRGFPDTVESHEAYFSNMRQRHLLATLLDMVEDRSMDVLLENVLKVGQKFAYAYDFGSTTDLSLKVLLERDGVVENERTTVEVLARNNAPVMSCRVCGKPATKVAAGYDFAVEENAYCTVHARKSKDAEMMLPIVNSPRVGICGYA